MVRGHQSISGKRLSLTKGAGYSLGYGLHRFVQPQKGHGFSDVLVRNLVSILTILITNWVWCLHSGLIGTHHADSIKSRMTEFFSPITRHVKERTYIDQNTIKGELSIQP